MHADSAPTPVPATPAPPRTEPEVTEVWGPAKPECGRCHGEGVYRDTIGNLRTCLCGLSFAAVAPVPEDREEATESAELELARLKRTVEFMEKQYLAAHGGSWGVCKYQSELTTLSASLVTLERTYETMVNEYAAKLDQQAAASLEIHDRDAKAWARVRDAVNEYHYLRRDCPDEATRDAGWQAVMRAMGYADAAHRHTEGANQQEMTDAEA